MTWRLRALASAALVGVSASPGLARNEYQIDSAKVVEFENHLVTNVTPPAGGADLAAIIGADRFHDAGYTGQNTIAYNIEAGHVWNGHETLGHVSTFTHDAGTFGTTTNDLFDRHATWVGMVIGGRSGGASPGLKQVGIAPGTDLRSGAIATSWAGSSYALSFGINSSTFATAFDAAFGTADVINSSYGGGDAAGAAYFSVAGDGMAFNNSRTTWVVSAGNSGPGSNTVESPGSAYNVITVGALQNSSNTYNSVASFSSRGPSPYSDPANGTINASRATVDIVAPGTNIVSAFYGGQTGGNNTTLAGSVNQPGNTNYTTVAGTSFAAPIVSGGVALLTSASRGEGLGADSRDARVIKSVLLNSARKTAGWNNGQSLSGGVVTTTQSLDWAAGAGALDLDAAYDQYLSGTTDVAGQGGGIVEEIGWDFGSVTAATSNIYFIDDALAGGSKLTATLSWFRDRDFESGTNNAYDDGFADLDLQVWSVVDNALTSLVAQSTSSVNNVEHLYFDIATTGLYAIVVDYFGTNFSTPGFFDASPDFGLAWAGTAVPEPTIFAILGLGVIGLAIRRRAA